MMSSNSFNSDSFKVISFAFSMTLSSVVEPGMGIMVGNPLRPLYDRTLVNEISIYYICVSSQKISLDDSDFHIGISKDEFEKMTHHARAIWAGVQPFAFATF